MNDGDIASGMTVSGLFCSVGAVAERVSARIRAEMGNREVLPICHMSENLLWEVSG